VLWLFGMLVSRPAAASTLDWNQLVSPGCSSGCPQSPPARGDTAVAYDVAAHTSVLFGGLTPQAQFLNDTWTFNGTVWTQAVAPGCSTSCPTIPSARFSPALAYDEMTRSVILFGGFGFDASGACCSALNDTWSFKGRRLDATGWGDRPAGLRRPIGRRLIAMFKQPPGPAARRHVCRWRRPVPDLVWRLREPLFRHL
jgi:hypothetical protein